MVSQAQSNKRERFHRTMQDECYNIIFRKKIYTSLAELQLDVDHWVHSYNRYRPHSGKLLDKEAGVLGDLWQTS